MRTGVNYTYCGDHFTILPTNIKSLYCTLETNTMYIIIPQFKRRRGGKTKTSPFVYECDTFQYFGNSLQHKPSEHFLCRRQLTKSCPTERYS